MNLVDFITNLVAGFGFADLTVEMQYAVLIASVNLVVLIVDKTFGLFALILNHLKRGD